MISLRAYARHRGVQLKAVQDAIESGRIAEAVVIDPKGNRKILSSGLGDELWEKNTSIGHRRRHDLREKDAKKAAPRTKKKGANGNPFQDARATRESFQAGLAELEYRKKTGELVPIDLVKKEWADIVSTARQKLLALPSQARAAIPGLGADGVMIIEDLVRDALGELAAGKTESDSGTKPN